MSAVRGSQWQSIPPGEYAGLVQDGGHKGSAWQDDGAASVAIAIGYFVETSPNVFRGTTDRSLATHALEHVGGGELHLEPLATVTSPARIARRGDDFFVYGV